MDDLILFTQLNDFVFCPASIYFHNLYSNQETRLFQQPVQVNGTDAHKAVDEGSYSTKKAVVTALDAYSERYGLVGKIDIYYQDEKLLVERKKKIKTIFDGYVFQLYAQYFAMKELGYEIEKLKLYSSDDNQNYDIPLPEDDHEMFEKFEHLVEKMRTFDITSFEQTNVDKCRGCIYEPACDRGLV